MRLAPRTLARLALTVLAPACAASAVAGGVTGARSTAVPAATGASSGARAGEAARSEDLANERIIPPATTHATTTADSRTAAEPPVDLIIAPASAAEARTSGTVVF